MRALSFASFACLLWFVGESRAADDISVAVVEQSGEAGFLFFRFPIEVTLASTERPPHVLEVSMLKGNLKRLDGAYRIESQAGGRRHFDDADLIEKRFRLELR